MRYLSLVILLACPAPEPALPPEPEVESGGELAVALDDAWMRDALEVGLDQFAGDSLRWVEHFSEVAEGEEADPRTDADGMVREALRYCGDDRLEPLQRLTRMLRDKVGVLGQDAFRCEGRRCTFSPVGEFDLDATLDLERAGDTFVIVAVTRIDSSMVSEEYLSAAHAWVDAALRELEPCP